MKEPFENIEVKIDQLKLRRMRYRIYGEERDNLRTKRYSNNSMVDLIRKIIVDEYRKKNF